MWVSDFVSLAHGKVTWAGRNSKRECPVPLTEKGCELTDFESYADIIQNSVNLSKAIVRGTRAMHSWHSKAAVNKHLHSAGLINNPHAMPWIDQRWLDIVEYAPKCPFSTMSEDAREVDSVISGNAVNELMPMGRWDGLRSVHRSNCMRSGWGCTSWWTDPRIQPDVLMFCIVHALIDKRSICSRSIPWCFLSIKIGLWLKYEDIQ